MQILCAAQLSIEGAARAVEATLNSLLLEGQSPSTPMPATKAYHQGRARPGSPPPRQCFWQQHRAPTAPGATPALPQAP